MIERVAATQRTLDRYKDKPFAWGRYDCAKMAQTHARLMGHRPRALPKYASAIGAKRALARRGFVSLEAALDAMFDRIAPAAALPGDLVLGASEDGVGAIYLVLGNGLIMGWHEDAEVSVNIALESAKAAWRL